MAQRQRIAAPELLQAGIVHRVLHEPAAEPDVVATTIAAAVAQELAQQGTPPRPCRR